MLIEVLEMGTEVLKELDGRDEGAVGAVGGAGAGGGAIAIGGGGGGLLIGAIFRIGKVLVVEFIVGAGDNESDATEETSLEMSDEWLVSKTK